MAALHPWEARTRPIDPALGRGRRQVALRAEMLDAGVTTNLDRSPRSAFWLPDWSARYLVGLRDRIGMVQLLRTGRNSAVPQIADARRATTASGPRGRRSTSVLLHPELLCSAEAVTVSRVRAKCPTRDRTLASPDWLVGKRAHFEAAAAIVLAGIDAAAAPVRRDCGTRTDALAD